MSRGPVPYVLFLACLASAGCQKTASERIVGKWRGTKAEGVVTEVQQAANEAASAMELEFKKDTVVIKSAQDKDPMTAHYFVLREDKRSVVLVTDQDGPRDEQTLTLDDDKTMRWQVLPGKTITFSRQATASRD